MAVPTTGGWPEPWTPLPAVGSAARCWRCRSGGSLDCGRGADALVALKRKVIHPRIRFAEAAISFLLLMAGALFTVMGIYAALSGTGSWMLVAALLMWAWLGGVGVRAWQMQRGKPPQTAQN